MKLTTFLSLLSRCQEIMATFSENVQNKKKLHKKVFGGIRWNQNARKDLDAEIKSLSEQNREIQKEIKEVVL